jgi:hypothetical protein
VAEHRYRRPIPTRRADPMGEAFDYAKELSLDIDAGIKDLRA